MNKDEIREISLGYINSIDFGEVEPMKLDHIHLKENFILRPGEDGIVDDVWVDSFRIGSGFHAYDIFVLISAKSKEVYGFHGPHGFKFNKQ